MREIEEGLKKVIYDVATCTATFVFEPLNVYPALGAFSAYADDMSDRKAKRIFIFSDDGRDTHRSLFEMRRENEIWDEVPSEAEIAWNDALNEMAAEEEIQKKLESERNLDAEFANELRRGEVIPAVGSRQGE